MMEVNSNLGASEASISTVTYNRPVSALEDPANYNIRHPLQSKWTLWYRASTKPNSTAVKNAAKSDNWEASLQCVNTVDTVEDFWGMYNNVPGIDKMEDSSDYMFFKEGIRPAWEDPANANGGSFTIQFKGNIPGIGEFVWLNTLMMVVGSTLTHFDKVTGIVYAKRSNRSDRLSLWLTSNDREICRQSEVEWLEMLQKVNQEGFIIGAASFTNHKGSGHHHRGNDRSDRGDRGGERGEREYRGDRGENRVGNDRDSREHRGENRGGNDRDSREYRGDNRGGDNRGVDNRGDNRGGDNRGVDNRGDNRDNREYRGENRDSRDDRGDRRPSGPSRFSSRGGGSSGFGGPRQSSEARPSNSDWNRQ